MTKPTGALHWADSPTTLRTEPAEPTKNTGLAVAAKLPAQWFNYIAGVCGDWITWLNTRLFDAYTLVTSTAEVRLYGETDVGMTVTADDGATKLAVICADPMTGADFNPQMATTVNWHDVNTVMLCRTTSESKNNGEYITWSWTGHDPSTMLDPITEQKITLAEAGSGWLVCFNAVFNNFDSAGVALIKNASTTLKGMQSFVLGLDGSQSMSFVGLVGGDGDPIAAGDYFRFQVSCGVSAVTVTEARVTFTRIF